MTVTYDHARTLSPPRGLATTHGSHALSSNLPVLKSESDKSGGAFYFFLPRQKATRRSVAIASVASSRCISTNKEERSRGRSAPQTAASPR